MDQVKGWLTFGCVVVFIAAAAPTSCAMFANQKITEMVEMGASPSEARCAVLSGSFGNNFQCLTAALLKQEK